MICCDDPRHPFNAIGVKQENHTLKWQEENDQYERRQHLFDRTRLQCALSDWEWETKTKVEKVVLKVSSIKENDKDNVNNAELESIFCAICTEPVGKDELVRILLICGHQFHKRCIDPWLERNHLCPTCKRSVKQYIPI